MKRLLPLFFTFIFLFVSVLPAFAGNLGVGIGTGKISINEKLKNGMTYKFPDLVIINTGDVQSDYLVSVSYNSEQKELLPPAEWFTFTPEVFNLKPGDSQKVEVRLKVPIDKVIPGDYFAYLEAKPVIEDKPGVSSVGIAAAAKLNFTIAPSNFLEGIYYTVKYVFDEYQPWSTVVLSAVVLVLLKVILSRFISIDLNIKSKKKES